MIKDKHVIEALSSKITIENGKITDVTEPKIENCPIFEKGHGIKKLTKENIKKNINFRMKHFGYCTKKREVSQEDTLVAVGISEILSTNIRLKKIDVVVGACDGVGTLLMEKPEIVQGVGGRVSGLVSTSPLPEIIEKVGKENVLFPETANLDPIAGIKFAIEKGYKNIAVTLLGGPIVKEIAEMKLPESINLFLLIAHTTGISRELAEECFEYGDIITGCASKHIREVAQEQNAYYYGKIVSIYAGSERGRELLDNHLKEIGEDLSTANYPQDKSYLPKPLL
ncbi:methanogenesis marker 8 protein [uncultured Methanobrevibacter sp.]|uniref:methanogenesis marker 8 protein n=1 Tax=uncultured Methanobrevibacter sp. TaxID=253161 RepID=UPI0025F8F7AB|nr:methanogenesis marker 8 protein [uncultured Methanobrevibacter sp.]